MYNISLDMDSAENDMHGTNYSSTQAHKSFPMHYVQWGKFFKAYLNILIFHEINIHYSDMQKYVSYKKRCKMYKYFVHRLAIHYGL